MNIGIVGLGLIGGSVAQAIRRNTPHTLLGYDIEPSVVCKAKLLGAIDGELDEARLPACDMVLVAIYPTEAIEYVKTHAHAFRPGCIVMDLCGVKRVVCDALWPVAREAGFVFVGAHPMAGIEHSGFDYARATLFSNASMLLTPPPGIDIETLQMLKRFWAAIGFTNLEITTPKEHDRRIAYTSQLAHVLSSSYIKSPTAKDHHGFSAGSYRDMTRVARLNETLWTQLFLANRENLSAEIRLLISHLQEYDDALCAGDEARLFALLREGRERKERTDKEE